MTVQLRIIIMMMMMMMMMSIIIIIIIKRQGLAFQLKDFYNRSNFCYSSGYILPRVKKCVKTYRLVFRRYIVLFVINGVQC